MCAKISVGGVFWRTMHSSQLEQFYPHMQHSIGTHPGRSSSRRRVPVADRRRPAGPRPDSGTTAETPSATLGWCSWTATLSSCTGRVFQSKHPHPEQKIPDVGDLWWAQIPGGQQHQWHQILLVAVTTIYFAVGFQSLKSDPPPPKAGSYCKALFVCTATDATPTTKQHSTHRRKCTWKAARHSRRWRRGWSRPDTTRTGRARPLLVCPSTARGRRLRPVRWT